MVTWSKMQSENLGLSDIALYYRCFFKTKTINKILSLIKIISEGGTGSNTKINQIKKLLPVSCFLTFYFLNLRFSLLLLRIILFLRMNDLFRIGIFSEN